MVPVVPLLWRFHYTGQLTVVPVVSLLYGGFTIQDSLLWSQWCPYYTEVSLYRTAYCGPSGVLIIRRFHYTGQLTVVPVVSLLYGGFTIQDSLLWSQWCPYYTEVSLYRTAYCGPSGALIVEVSL